MTLPMLIMSDQQFAVARDLDMQYFQIDLYRSSYQKALQIITVQRNTQAFRRCTRLQTDKLQAHFRRPAVMLFNRAIAGRISP